LSPSLPEKDVTAFSGRTCNQNPLPEDAPHTLAIRLIVRVGVRVIEVNVPGIRGTILRSGPIVAGDSAELFYS